MTEMKLTDKENEGRKEQTTEREWANSHGRLLKVIWNVNDYAKGKTVSIFFVPMPTGRQRSARLRSERCKSDGREATSLLRQARSFTWPQGSPGISSVSPPPPPPPHRPVTLCWGRSTNGWTQAAQIRMDIKRGHFKWLGRLSAAPDSFFHLSLFPKCWTQ